MGDVMNVAIETIRNIGIVAHIDAGKTTTTERILFYSGASHRMGNVDDGTTITDFDPDEAKRGITIYSAAITCKWNDHTINIIDTPGHVDFTAEVERSLRVLDGAVMIFSAVEGVEAQSETVWRQANRYQVPRICFINKMDRIGADFDRTFSDIVDRLSAQPVALQIPIGSNTDLKGLIDLVEMKALYFDSAAQGAAVTEGEIPEDYLDAAQEWRQRLLESVADLDDVAMEELLETEDISSETIHNLLRVATLEGLVQPTFCGTSLDYIGVQPLLDGVCQYLPSPIDRPPVEGEVSVSKKKRRKQDDETKTEARDPSAKEPFCGLVFKIQADQHGDLCFLRVYSGVLKSGSRVLNARTGKKELVSQIWRVQADSREKVETDEVSAGDIIGVIGPKEASTGDTLCDTQKPLLLESITFPETVISMAVEPDSSAERKKLEETLARLSRQDPTFNAQVSEDTGQTIISGMGELHLEVLRERMQRDFGLKVRVHKPRVSYRETIRSTVQSEGEFNRAQAGTTQFAKVKIQLEAFEGDETLTFENNIKHGTLPADLMAILDDAVADEASGGGVLGYPLMNIKFTLIDAVYRDGETTDIALQAAATDAIRQSLNQDNMVLLEPVMRLEVVTPDEFLGNIQADLNARRAIILSSERRGDLALMEAQVSLAQMFGYSTQIRSLSQGRASSTMEPLKYDEAPSDVLKEMLW